MNVEMIRYGLEHYARSDINPWQTFVVHITRGKGGQGIQTPLPWTEVARSALAYIDSLEKVAQVFSELPEGQFYWRMTKEIDELRRKVQDLEERNAWQAKQIQKKGRAC